MLGFVVLRFPYSPCNGNLLNIYERNGRGKTFRPFLNWYKNSDNFWRKETITCLARLERLQYTESPKVM